MRVRAVYPIFPILRTDSNIFRENYRGLIKHLSAEREISIRGDWHGGEKLAVRITRFTKAQRNQLPKKFLLEPRWSVEFSGSFKFPGSKEFNVKDQDRNIIETPISALKSYWRDLLPDILDLQRGLLETSGGLTRSASPIASTTNPVSRRP